MDFVKMQGAGNDYIFVDCTDCSVPDMSALAVAMSDRHFGVGGDGVVYLYPSFVADISMRMFNADGSEGAMCGNAVRCIARLLLGKTGKKNVTVETPSGVRTVVYDEQTDSFTVEMGQPVFYEVDKPLMVNGKQFMYTYLTVGNPHCVIFVDDVDRADMALGEAIQHHTFFPGGVNVEFTEPQGDRLKVRVYERGSGETLSCGTGACAAAVTAMKLGAVGGDKDKVVVSLRGGDLGVSYKNGKLYLRGNATEVYEGDYHDKIHLCNRRCGQRTR